jgi:uncharacterized membrane protein
MGIYKINIQKSVIAITIFAVILNILRVIIWGKVSFVYILWNMFLAFIPFLISSLLLSLSKEGKLNKITFIVGGILWLLFIPNAPYIITDFIHLGEIRTVPVLYDTMLLFSSAIVGLILGFHSLSHVEEIIKTKCSKITTSIFMAVIILLISFGIYLGRFLRFNSWDIFVNHTSLSKNIWEIISQAAVHLEVYCYTLLFFSFLYIFYKAWKYSNTK